MKYQLSLNNNAKVVFFKKIPTSFITSFLLSKRGTSFELSDRKISRTWGGGLSMVLCYQTYTHMYTHTETDKHYFNPHALSFTLFLPPSPLPQPHSRFSYDDSQGPLQKEKKSQKLHERINQIKRPSHLFQRHICQVLCIGDGNTVRNGTVDGSTKRLWGVKMPSQRYCSEEDFVWPFITTLTSHEGEK